MPPRLELAGHAFRPATVPNAKRSVGHSIAGYAAAGAPAWRTRGRRATRMGVIAGSNPGQGPGASPRVDPPIAPGEKVGLIGRNGVGKSTLFGLLDCVFQPIVDDRGAREAT